LEHKWGRNVFAYGFGGEGCTLAARIRTGRGEGKYILNENHGLGVKLWTIPADEQFPYSSFLDWFPGIGNRFPYGYNVEPNPPV